MWIDITIQPRDMNGAKRQSCAKCPVARAIRRLLPEKHWVYVGGKFAIVGNCESGNSKAFQLPTDAVAWISEYDKSKPGKPPKRISFRVNIPKRFLRKELVA